LDTTGDVIFYDNKAKNAGIAIATVRLFNGIPSTNPVFSTDYVCPYTLTSRHAKKIRMPVRQMTDIPKRKPARPIDGCTWP